MIPYRPTLERVRVVLVASVLMLMLMFFAISLFDRAQCTTYLPIDCSVVHWPSIVSAIIPVVRLLSCRRL